VLLVVDDDEDAIFFVRHRLAKCGIAAELIVARDGGEAIALFERCLSTQTDFPALVLLDIKMPGIGGFGVLEWLRAHELLGRTTVVIHSSSDHPGDVSRAMMLGAHSCLAKPITETFLRELLATAARFSGNRNHGHGNTPPQS